MNEFDGDWSRLPFSRSEAIRLGVRHYFTGKPCMHGHVAPHRASDYRCTVCHAHERRRQKLRTAAATVGTVGRRAGL